MISVLIADDQELIRESLELLVSSDKRFEVVGTAEDGKVVLQKASELKPDVILMDIRMPESHDHRHSRWLDIRPIRACYSCS